MAVSIAAQGVLQGITRNRTGVYIAYRNQRHPSSATVLPGKNIELVVQDGASLINGAPEADDNAAIEAPPRWIPAIEDIRSTLSLIHSKLSELQRLHEGQFLVQIDDSGNEQHEIEIATAELTRLLSEAQGRVKALGTAGAAANPEESRLLKNVQSALATQLGEATKRFRQSQQSYLTKLRKRNQKVRGTLSGPAAGDDDDDTMEYTDKGFTDGQMAQLTATQNFVTQRDKDIRAIHKSIVELSEITKDLAVLIVDQGTLLDRIDYNVEVASETTKEAVAELRKANESQKGVRTKLCIILLLVAVMLGMVILLFKAIF